jgi:hypothetical protein
MDWTDLSDDRDHWRVVAHTEINLHFFLNIGEFSGNWATGDFLRRTQLHGVKLSSILCPILLPPDPITSRTGWYWCFVLGKPLLQISGSWPAILNGCVRDFCQSLPANRLLCSCLFNLNIIFDTTSFNIIWSKLKTKLHGLSPRANYTDRATAACRRSNCQLLRIEGATWSAWRIPPAVFSVF